jgi:hypothetical protein
MSRLIWVDFCRQQVVARTLSRWASILLLATSGLLSGRLEAQLIRATGNDRPTPKFPEVLIYYATETAPDGPAAQNAHQIAGWLAGISDSEAQKESKSVLNDLTVFPSVAHSEIAAIEDSRTTRNVLIFSNEMTRAGSYLLGREGERPARAHFYCRDSDSRDPIAAGSPLSSPECLAAALKEAASRFTAASYSFTLLLNGHGSRDRVLMPRICVHSEEISQEWLANIFEGRGGESARKYRSRYGISKAELLNVLGTAVPNMHLRLVLLHSCHSSLPSGTVLPKNIGVIWTYADSVEYNSIDFPLVLNSYLVRNQRQAALALAYLEVRGLATKLIWFLPLTLYCAWSVFSARKGSAKRSRLAVSNW